MKQPLIDIVRSILSEMDSDEVFSVNDTPESQQVAEIAKQCYFEMIANRNWPHLKKLSYLEHSGEPSKPTHMKMPSDMKELIIVKYDKRRELNESPTYLDVKFLYPDDFLRITSSKNRNNQHIQEVVDYGGTRIYVATNQPPRYWTTFDDEYLVFDSYDVGVDDALKSEKSQILYYRIPMWSPLDDAVPDLPAEAFPAFIEEVKSTAFFTLKQMVNDKAEQKANRQQRWLSRKAWKAQGGVRYPDFGRKSRR